MATGRIMVADIQRVVAEHFHVPVQVMQEPDGPGTRYPHHAHPRQLAMFMARELTPMSLPEIGRRFGGRDHTTVLFANRAVEKRISKDENLRASAEKIGAFLCQGHLIHKGEKQALVSAIGEAE